MLEKIRQYAKFIAALISAVAVSFAGLLPEEWSPWVQAIIALLGAVSVLAIPNALTERQKSEDVPDYVSQNGIGRHIA